MGNDVIDSAHEWSKVDHEWSFAEELLGVADECISDPWAGSTEFIALGKVSMLADLRDLPGLISFYDRELKSIGGDSVTSRDWSGFRPLRLDREEDWSEWLAQLIEDSTDLFLVDLLGLPRDLARHQPRNAYRELRAGDRRADILIVMSNTGWEAHLEVKIWDKSLSKTWETAKNLERARPHVRHWRHRILIPESIIADWDTTSENHNSAGLLEGPEIKAFTWTDIAIELRRALLSGNESVRWRVWAQALLGCIEQEIVGIPFLGNREQQRQELTSFKNYSGLMTLQRIMRQGRER